MQIRDGSLTSWGLSELAESPYLLPPLQLTENSLEALVHVVKLLGTASTKTEGGGGVRLNQNKTR